MTAEHTNALAAETSPYLRQHAGNPVDWLPWGEAALERARREDKPILVSVGYSACHWCHVMAHESFEDAQTAQVMNTLFVNVKVDREERPDLDKVYQLAHQILTQRGGGWPLTMFLTPGSLIPFFGGTYFPREGRHGLPPFTQVLRRVADFYRDHRDDIERQNRLVAEALNRVNPPAPEAQSGLSAEPLDLSRNQLGQLFDARYGGFGEAPKFPHPPHLGFLLRHWAATALAQDPDNMALEMATVTLDAMAAGGLYDHLGGGFFRYSVDGRWTVPHFEKMLYDNGQLLVNYAEAWQATGHAVYGHVARRTARWVMDHMQSPDGGYYSSLDADSDGEEGGYYLWEPGQVAGVLGGDEYRVAARYYGLEGPPNFEGKWHLQACEPLDQVAASLGMSRRRAEDLLAGARVRLLAARDGRTAPGRDEKVLTAWNGLMIKGMAVAGRLLGEAAFVVSAGRALGFIQSHAWRDGRLLASCKDGRARHAAYLDDYVFLIDGVLELLQVRWRDGDLAFAVALAEVVLEHFEDPAAGGFFFTADDHERLIQRPKPVSDDALPAGNGVAALALGRLGHLVGEPRYLDAAERTLKAAWPSVMQIPYAHNTLLLALDDVMAPPELVVVRGMPAQIEPWLARCRLHYSPRRLVFPVPPGADGLVGHLAQCVPRGDAVAYVCRDLSCSAPVTRLEELDALLSQTDAAASGVGIYPGAG